VCVAALDYGKVRVGVAVSDDLGMLAHPRAALAAQPRKQLLQELKAMVQDDEITRFIIGLPLHMSGQEGVSSAEARKLGEEVAQATGLPVEFWDERLSTVQAGRAFQERGIKTKKSKGRIDSASACVILQAWLDRQASQL
jgi:putative holliday junction resolvase